MGTKNQIELWGISGWRAENQNRSHAIGDARKRGKVQNDKIEWLIDRSTYLQFFHISAD